MTRAEVRARFRALGYTASLKTNPLTDKLLMLSVKVPGHDSPVNIGTASVFPTEFYNKHKAMFEVADFVRGLTMSDTNQRIS